MPTTRLSPHPSHLRVARLAIPPHALQLCAQQSRSCSSLVRDAERRSWRGGEGGHLQLAGAEGIRWCEEGGAWFCDMNPCVCGMEGLEAVERLELGTVVGLILWVSLGD